MHLKGDRSLGYQLMLIRIYELAGMFLLVLKEIKYSEGEL